MKTSRLEPLWNGIAWVAYAGYCTRDRVLTWVEDQRDPAGRWARRTAGEDER